MSRVLVAKNGWVKYNKHARAACHKYHKEANPQSHRNTNACNFIKPPNMVSQVGYTYTQRKGGREG